MYNVKQLNLQLHKCICFITFAQVIVKHNKNSYNSEDWKRSYLWSFFDKDEHSSVLVDAPLYPSRVHWLPALSSVTFKDQWRPFHTINLRGTKLRLLTFLHCYLVPSCAWRSPDVFRPTLEFQTIIILFANWTIAVLFPLNLTNNLLMKNDLCFLAIQTAFQIQKQR